MRDAGGAPVLRSSRKTAKKRTMQPDETALKSENHSSTRDRACHGRYNPKNKKIPNQYMYDTIIGAQ
jgi:hypothetical protein